MLIAWKRHNGPIKCREYNRSQGETSAVHGGCDRAFQMSKWRQKTSQKPVQAWRVH